MNCIYLEASHKIKLFQAKELQQLNDLKQKKKKNLECWQKTLSQP